MAEQTKIWFHNIRVAFSCPQRSASVHHCHEICDTVQPVHKKMDTVGNRYTLGVLDDTPWASSTGLAARPSQSFILALLDLSCEPAPGSLAPSSCWDLCNQLFRGVTLLAGKCCLFSILLMPYLLDLLTRFKQYNPLYRCHVRGGE